MSKDRLVAFSDGVIAVIITIMVLEIKTPHGGDLRALATIWPGVRAYVLSFAFVGIYWNNHHHLFSAVRRIDGATMWLNLDLLFWLSLVPLATAWRGEYPHAPWPAAVFGVLLLACAVAYTLLTRALIRSNGEDSAVARAVRHDVKGRVSIALYLIAIPLAFASTWLSDACFAAVSIIWFVPDRRIERALRDAGDQPR